MPMLPSDLATAIDELRMVDTHEHLGLPPRIAPENRWLPAPVEREWVEAGPDILGALFANYVTADLIVAGATRQAVERLVDRSAGDLEARWAGVSDAWEATKLTGYGEAVRLIATEIFALDDFTVEGFERAQTHLEELQRPGEMLRLLRETARLDHVQIHHFAWECEADASAPEFFLYDLSWGEFCNGVIEREQILAETDIEVRTLDDLRTAMAAIFDRHGPYAIAVKSHHAYYRTLRWEKRSDSDAASALAAILSGKRANESASLVLGDWCWARGVEFAIQHNLPFKLHTGHYAGVSEMPIDRVRAGNLCGLLAGYPEARFVLMHAAYPYTDELVSIAKHYANVWVDMCWAWSIDPYSAADFVRRFVHAAPANKLFAFGGDTNLPTSAVAYATQARRWLACALEDDIAHGDLTEKHALDLVQRIMRDNQYACFDIEGTRSALREREKRRSNGKGAHVDETVTR